VPRNGGVPRKDARTIAEPQPFPPPLTVAVGCVQRGAMLAVIARVAFAQSDAGGTGSPIPTARRLAITAIVEASSWMARGPGTAGVKA